MDDKLELRLRKLEEQISILANAINTQGITAVTEKVSIHERLDKIERELKIISLLKGRGAVGGR